MDTEKVLKNLRIQGREDLLIINAPDVFKTAVSNLAYDEAPAAAKQVLYDFVQVFATTQAELEKTLKEVERCGKYDCVFWACYPKKTGTIKSDIQRETVWKAFVSIGLDTVTAISIDDTWSALRGRPVEAVGK